MSNGYQLLTVVGNVAGQVQEGTLQNGKPVANFTVIVNEDWTDQNNAVHEKKVAFRVAVMNGQAKPCLQYLYSGRQVMVVGQLQADQYGNPQTWVDREGNTRSQHKINARNVQFLSHTQAYLNGNVQTNSNGNGQQQTAEQVEAERQLEVDQIPF